MQITKKKVYVLVLKSDAKGIRIKNPVPLKVNKSQ